MSTGATPEVIAFKRPHSPRNNWLRLGLMQLHKAGEIRYREQALKRCRDFGFSEAAERSDFDHASYFAIARGGRWLRCVVESNDSFLVMAPELMVEADLYFCSGYNRAFFEDRRFETPYAWLEPHETAWYHAQAQRLVDACGEHFGKVRPFIPIGPNVPTGTPRGPLRQKIVNARHKAALLLGEDEPWDDVYAAGMERLATLKALRGHPADYDVVLHDSLWGWPRHRIALHKRLAALAATRRIHARLVWKEPNEKDGSDRTPLYPDAFPIETGHVGDLEPMLARSRLVVLATGFHWGWRNLMTLALYLGLPVHIDRLILEPHFRLDAFAITENDSADWDDLEERLDAMTDAAREQAAARNIAAAERYLEPIEVARYFVTTARAA